MTEQQPPEQPPSSPPPDFLRKTLVGRSAFAFQVAILGENAGALLNESYIEGLCKEQKDLTKSIGRLYWISIALGWALLAKTIQWESFSTTVLGVIVPSGLITKQVIFIAMAMIFAQCVLKIISLMILAHLLLIAAQHHFGDAWKLYVAKFDADTLWADIFSIRLIGYRSSIPHIVFSIFVFLILLLTSLFQVIFVNVASYDALMSLEYSSEVWLERLLPYLSFSIVVFATLGLFVACVVPFKFKLKK